MKQELKIAVVQAYRSRERTYPELAELFGVTPCTIWRIVRESGALLGIRGVRKPKVNPLEIIYAYKEGYSKTEIKLLLGASDSTIEYYFRKFHIRMRTHKEAAKLSILNGRSKLKAGLAKGWEWSSTTGGYWKGKKQPLILRLRKSLSQKGKFAMENNPMWRGGTSKRKYDPSWGFIRRVVLERDNYQCKHCGKTEHLHVHHIVPKRLGGSDELDNLLTLCRKCHKRAELSSLYYWMVN